MDLATIRSGAVLGALFVAGCTVGPEYRVPDLSARTEAAWRAPADGPIATERESLAGWWERFGSPELSDLSRRLVAQNLSLAEARQRVLGARAQRGVARAQALPAVEGGASVTRAGTGKNSLNFQGPPPGSDVTVDSISVSAGWELDLWGRVERLVEAADAEIDVSVEDYHAATVSLLAELALAYVDAATLHRRLDVLANDVSLRRDTLRLARSRRDAGNGSALDVSRAERELATSRAREPELQRELALAENRVAVLVGERPCDDLPAAADELTLPAAVGLGLPADLLARRADVRRSERALAASVARVGVAEAERYPDVSINGTLALRARNVDTLIGGPGAVSYSVGPSLSVPLFTGGRLDNQVELRQSQADAARLAFERSLLDAIAEVENAAAGVARTRERLDLLEAAAAAAHDAVDLAAELYDAGSSGLDPLIDSQRFGAAADDALLLGRQAAFVQTIALYRAMGGGWEPIGLDGSIRKLAASEETDR